MFARTALALVLATGFGILNARRPTLSSFSGGDTFLARRLARYFVEPVSSICYGSSIVTAQPAWRRRGRNRVVPLATTLRLRAGSSGFSAPCPNYTEMRFYAFTILSHPTTPSVLKREGLNFDCLFVVLVALMASPSSSRMRNKGFRVR
jgi:hypothetical protein